MTSEQMLKTKLPPGKIFKNVAKLGSKPNWKILLSNGSFADKTERFSNADPDCCWCHGRGIEYIDCGNEHSGYDYRFPCRCRTDYSKEKQERKGVKKEGSDVLLSVP